MYSQNYLTDLIINQVEESLNLDYKAALALDRTDKKTIEISKDVSSFANSNGGTIIYGMLEDNEDKHLPIAIDPIDRESISKEWLEQIIQGKIRPRIDGIEIHPIEIDGNKKRVVYLVEIPQSNTVHQADDKRYYKRFNFMSVPMYDYEIRDVLNRVKTPIINLEFEVARVTTMKTNSNNLNVTNTYLNVYARNEGRVIAHYINSYIKVPENCIEDKFMLNDSIKKEGFFADNTIRYILDTQVQGETFVYKYGPSRYDPILPRMRMKLDFKIPRLQEYYNDYENEISWILFADNAEPRTGKIRFHDMKKIY